MPANKKPEVRGRTAQFGIKVDVDLYEKYKTKLRESGISITDDIENHMRNYVGELVVQSNVIDIAKLFEDMEALKREVAIVEDLKKKVAIVEDLEKIVGELQPGWQQKISTLKAS
ncbi:hypothetical protein [Nostoc sp.]|uniref:hypothetical protein n=1 Tax=Nostoc sp. TaxID=1180 RepID=UPI002FF9DD42